jgi:hypothetical protein
MALHSRWASVEKGVRRGRWGTPPISRFIVPPDNEGTNVGWLRFRRLREAGLPTDAGELSERTVSRYAAVVPAPVLQRLMRHSDIKTTLGFYANVDDVLDDAIRKA